MVNITVKKEDRIYKNLPEKMEKITAQNVKN